MKLKLSAFLAAGLAACSSAPPPGSLKPLEVPAFQLPYSSYTSAQAKAQAEQLLTEKQPIILSIGMAREHYGKFNDARLVEMRKAYDTKVESRTLGGVKVDWVTPAEGVGEANKDRVLINAHGGGFMWGSGAGALIEAMPIAVTGKIAVAAVDYRLAPEAKWPATSEDMAAVYRELLKTYRPENIGIYGCSAGGVITSQTIPWLRAHGLPRPGAIAPMCGAGFVAGGDSGFLAPAASGQKVPGIETAGPGPLPVPYMEGVKLDDPLGYPMSSDEQLRCFPPTLLLAGGRDFASSMMTTVHRRLAAVDVYSELYLFDGLWHGFFVYPDLPESKETYRLIARFFERQLGRPAALPAGCGAAP